MSNVPDKVTFETAYSGEAPWDIPGPQPSFVAFADQITGRILDAGCGTGEHSLFFAGRGREVIGIDFLAEPIRRAKQKAIDRSLTAQFEVSDALTLKDCSEQFDNVIDSGLFHCFSDDDRKAYVEGLGHVLKSGGKLFLMCFSDAEPGEQGPRRISRDDLQKAFANGWQIESIEPTAFETNPNFKGMDFSPGGPKSWFVIVRRS
jgi:cyclopropane fatty-acyl-phospholipid synthase-like methyltransferase